jgi:hypothetical protein
MSDEYSDNSGITALRGDDMHEPQKANLRIAIRARVPETADMFWQELEARLARKGKIPAQRSVTASADTIIHILTEDDFADGQATRAASAWIASESAAQNILLEPAISEVQARRRMTETLSDFARRPGYVRLAVQKDAKEPADLLRHQARAVSRLLLNEPAASQETAGIEKRDRSEKKARKHVERDLKKAQKKVEDMEVSVSAPITSAIDKNRTERKAQRHAEKEGRKAEKRAGTSLKDGRDDGESVAVSATMPDARAAKRAARKAEKAKSGGEESKKRDRKRKNNASADGVAGEADRSERKAARAAQKAERKAGKHDEDDSRRGLSFVISGLNENARIGLFKALERKVAGVALEVPSAERKCDIAVHGFDDPAAGVEAINQRLEAIASENARVRIFLERAGSSVGEFAEENRAIAKLASACGGSLLRLDGKIRRFGDGLMSTGGEITEAGHDLIADAILGVAAAVQSRLSITRPLPAPPPDLAEVRALAGSPTELLAQLRWDDSIAPKLLWTSSSKEMMEALIDEKLPLASEQMLGLRPPIAWPEEISDRATSVQVLGLEFLIGPLSYWYSKAGGHSSKQLAEIDAVLKDRGIKASEILSRAEKVMMDFAASYPASRASDAWQEKAISRRVRVLVLYVLCCKMAVKRHIRFDMEAFTLIFRNLLDMIEVLRADDFYKPASIEGFEQDCLLIGLGLALRGTAYGDRLLSESLERLRTLQLDVGFTVEGVWRMGPFSDHCSLLSTFKTLIGDFDKSDAALVEPFAAAAKKMTVFAEALLKSNGMPPAFDDSKQKSFASKLSGTRRALAQAGGKSIAKSKLETMPRIADTYVFRDAQYFVSHSTQKISEESSLVILHADGPSIVEGDPGGVTLAFARGATDLLRRAEPPALEKKKDRSPLFDPALRNGYHIDGIGFAGGEFRQNAARIVKSWRGPGWAAARSVDEINPAGVVARVVIHLKAVHALIVVDDLKSRSGGDATFEQFWHIAPALAARPGINGTLRFASPDGGVTVAFDADDAVAIEAEGEGSRIGRSRRLENGFMATLLQWTRAPEAAMIGIMRSETEDWSVSASGAGFDVRLVLSGDELRYEESKRG